MSYVNKDIVLKDYFFLVELDNNVLTLVDLVDEAVWIFINQRVVWYPTNLNTYPKLIPYSWQIPKVDLLQNHSFWLSDTSLKQFFEIENIPNLWRLCDSLTMWESFPPIISNCILSCVCKANIQQIWTNKCTSPPFTSITVNHYYIQRICLQKLIHLLAYSN